MYNVYVRYAVQCTVSFVVTTKETEKKYYGKRTNEQYSRVFIATMGYRVIKKH